MAGACFANLAASPPNGPPTMIHHRALRLALLLPLALCTGVL